MYLGLKKGYVGAGEGGVGDGVHTNINVSTSIQWILGILGKSTVKITVRPGGSTVRSGIFQELSEKPAVADKARLYEVEGKERVQLYTYYIQPNSEFNTKMTAK